MEHLAKTDPQIYELIKHEETRQREKIRLIPSENYTSKAVMEATGSVLCNKYSEGYANKRYYEGQQIVDQIEIMTIERAKKLFSAEHANVQPYSGSPANMAAYYAFVEPGDMVMGMSLPFGGHLTHGWHVNFSGITYKSVGYTTRKEDGLIDYDEVMKLAKEHKPKIIFAGATAYPRIIDFKAFKEIADSVGAKFVADIAHIAGLIAGGAHPSPIPYADVVTTTTHKTLRGPRGGLILCKEEHAKAIDRAVFPRLQGGPHDNTVAALSVALHEADTDDFKNYAHQVVKNAKILAEHLMSYGFNLVTGGTDNHLMLIDLTNKNVPGKPIAQALDKAGVVLNYNSVPYDQRKPFDPSGIRIGTPSVTSRGMKEADMKFIADKINAITNDHQNESLISKTADEVKEFCKSFPAPGLDI